MSKIICFEKWDYDCGTLNQMSFEFDDSITINQISKLADRILNDYYDESETNDEIELDEVYIYNKCYEFCKEQGLIFNTIKPDITVSLDTQRVHIKEDFIGCVYWRIYWCDDKEYEDTLSDLYKDEDFVLYLTNKSAWYDKHNK